MDGVRSTRGLLTSVIVFILSLTKDRGRVVSSEKDLSIRSLTYIPIGPPYFPSRCLRPVFLCTEDQNLGSVG